MSAAAEPNLPLRVLLVAEHASRRFGGEAILPFHYFRLLRQRGVDAYLIVHARTRGELEAAFPDDLDRLRFVEDMHLQKVFFRLGSLLPRRIGEVTFGLLNQFLTQSAQRRIVRSLVQPNTVVHQPIPVAPRFPSLLVNVGAPVICGPMNGGMEYPQAFRTSESLPSRITIALGRAASQLANRLLRGKLEARLLLVANQRTAAALPHGVRGRVVELVENGVDLEQWQASVDTLADAPSKPTVTAPATFLFMGRLVDWKALDLALEALVRVPCAQLQVIGDGPMAKPWQDLAARLELAGRIHFRGWQSQQECARALAGSTALVLPSLFECGGAVVLEAMAAGRPVIATRWGGPADYLDETCGFLLEPLGREAMIVQLARAMQTLIDSPERTRAMGQAGHAKASANFSWQQKMDHMLALYQSL